MDGTVQTSVASEILATIYDGRTFDTWEEVESFKGILRTDLFMPVIFVEKRTTATHNSKVRSAKLDHMCQK